MVLGVQNYEACHENIRENAESAGNGEQVAFALSHKPVCCSTSDGKVHCSNDTSGMQVDGCKTALREILALQAEAKAYAGALDGLAQSYQPALDDTKFAEQIERRKQLIEQQNPCGTT